MKCLMKYQWVKLPRNHLPEGKGIVNQELNAKENHYE